MRDDGATFSDGFVDGGASGANPAPQSNAALANHVVDLGCGRQEMEARGRWRQEGSGGKREVEERGRWKVEDGRGRWKEDGL